MPGHLGERLRADERSETVKRSLIVANRIGAVIPGQEALNDTFIAHSGLVARNPMLFCFRIHDFAVSFRLDFEQSLLFDLLCRVDNAAM